MLLCLYSSLMAQQNNTWYFGHNAGLDFSSGSPVALTTGALYTDEGSAAISDNSGNLLFYTDGRTVWDRTHSVMPGGTGLWGDISSTQSALIVPNPGNANIYYIFTTDQGGSGAHGVNFYTVDMSMNSGLGAVTAGPVGLISGTQNTEKLAAVCHANGHDTWVITHLWNSGDFYAYQVTSAGVNTTPVVSTAGAYYGTPANSTSDKPGELKASPGGNKLAMGRRMNGPCEIFDFNRSTGAVTNAVTFSSTAGYGIEWSPDGTKIYNSQFTNVYQYDITTGITTTLYSTSTVNYCGEAELGPDGKIYIARKGLTSIDVISNPNAAGASCNYTTGAQSLSGKVCDLGLVNSYTPCPQPCTVNPMFSFNNQNCTFSFTDITTAVPGTVITGWNWTFGDGYSSTEQNPVHTYAGSGTYNVCLTVTGFDGYQCCTQTVCLFLTASCIPAPCMLNPDFSFSSCPNSCTVDLSAFMISANRTIGGYYWDFGDGTKGGEKNVSHTYSSSGTYTVCLTVIGLDNGTCCTQTICKPVTVNCGVVSNRIGNNTPGNTETLTAKDPGKMAVYPNPSSGAVTIDYEIGTASDVTLTLINAQGMEVRQFITGKHQQAGPYSVSIDTSELQPGVYMLVLRAGDSKEVKKISVTRE